MVETHGLRFCPVVCKLFTVAFSCLQVTKCFEGSLDPEKRYIFAYMPHGMLPAGVVYMPFLPSWRQQFPGLEPVGLTASVIHWVPFMRDAIQLLGGREVRPDLQVLPVLLLRGNINL